MTALRYETIPTYVEAMQFDGTMESAQAILEWADSTYLQAIVTNESVCIEIVLGQVKVGIGKDDWVVKDLEPGTAPGYVFNKIEPKAFAQRYREATDG